MPDLIRHPVPTWIPAFAGMTILRYLIAGVITRESINRVYLFIEKVPASLAQSPAVTAYAPLIEVGVYKAE